MQSNLDEPLRGGDVVVLRLSDHRRGLKDVGIVNAEHVISRAGVLYTSLHESRTGVDYDNCAFRLVNKLSYR